MAHIFSKIVFFLFQIWWKNIHLPVLVSSHVPPHLVNYMMSPNIWLVQSYDPLEWWKSLNAQKTVKTKTITWPEWLIRELDSNNTCWNHVTKSSINLVTDTVTRINHGCWIMWPNHSLDKGDHVTKSIVTKLFMWLHHPLPCPCTTIPCSPSSPHLSRADVLVMAGLKVEASGNVFMEDLHNARNLETTSYITDLTQAFDFHYERESGLQVGMAWYW